MILVRSQLNTLLFSLLGNQQLVEQWWDGSNKAFDGQTPNDVYYSGEQGRQQVANYILQFCDGAYR